MCFIPVPMIAASSLSCAPLTLMSQTLNRPARSCEAGAVLVRLKRTLLFTSDGRDIATKGKSETHTLASFSGLQTIGMLMAG